MPNHILISPDGNEHPTDDETYRVRLLSQGYTEKPPEPPAPPQDQAPPDPSPAMTGGATEAADPAVSATRPSRVAR